MNEQVICTERALRGALWMAGAHANPEFYQDGEEKTKSPWFACHEGVKLIKWGSGPTMVCPNFR